MMTLYEEIDGQLVPVWLAEYADRMALYYRYYPGPGYEERRREAAERRASECKTDAQRRITERSPDYPSNTLLERHHE